MGMLPTSCGLSVTPQSAPAVPSPIHGLQPAPHWVVDRMTSEAPDLYFDLKSHVLRARERRKLDQIAPALQDLLRVSGTDPRDCRWRRKRVPVWRSRGSQVWGYDLASGGRRNREEADGFCSQAGFPSLLARGVR